MRSNFIRLSIFLQYDIFQRNSLKKEGDSIPVLIPITSKEYKTDNYRAIVSGYKPSLDFMEVFKDKEIVTLLPIQKKR